MVNYVSLSKKNIRHGIRRDTAKSRPSIELLRGGSNPRSYRVNAHRFQSQLMLFVETA